MSTYFTPTKPIKLSKLQSICKKYGELELKDMFDDSSDPNEGRNFIIQSTFKKDITHPYTEFNGDFNFIVVNCIEDPSNTDDYYVKNFRMVGSRPFHIVKIIQYETEIVINDEYTIDDFKMYENVGTEDLSDFEESLWNEMNDEEKEPFVTNM